MAYHHNRGRQCSLTQQHHRFLYMVDGLGALRETMRARDAAESLGPPKGRGCEPVCMATVLNRVHGRVRAVPARTVQGLR